MTDLHEMAGSPAAFRDALLVPTGRGEFRFADIQADFQREAFASLDPALIAIARGEQPPIGRHWWERTKGGSKDTDLAMCCLWLLAFTTRPLTIQIGAADQDQADELRKAAKGILHCNEWLGQAVKVNNWEMVCQRTYSTCEIVAADITGSHGARPDVLILNELTHIAKREFAENLLDNAAKIPRSLVVVATNAGVLDSWQYAWRELARTSARWMFHKYDKPAPWLDPAEMDEARRRNSVSRYARLWGGVWVTDAGDAAINDDDLTAALTQPGPMNVYDAGRYSFLGGLDLAYRRDHSGFVVLASDHLLQRVRLAHAREWEPVAGVDIDLRDVKADILAARDKFGLQYVLCDEAQAVLMGQLLADDGVYLIPVPQSGKPAAARTMALIDAFKTRVIDLYDMPALTRDLKKLRAVERNNSVRLEATADEHGHADTAFAFSFALQLAVENCHKMLCSGEDFTIERAILV